MVELTYNYGVKTYPLGDDFQWLTVQSTVAYQKALTLEYCTQTGEDVRVVMSPDGYLFKIVNSDVEPGQDPVAGVAIRVTSLDKSLG